jgi:hypothetical protein
LIEPEPFKQKQFKVNETAEDLFESWAGFKLMLEELNDTDSQYLEEFKNFFSVFESKNYSYYVDYKFSKIPVNKKNRR